MKRLSKNTIQKLTFTWEVILVPFLLHMQQTPTIEKFAQPC